MQLVPESRLRLCQHPLQIPLIFLSINLSRSSVALRVVALVVPTAAAPAARPPGPARSIEGRLVQGGPGLPASSDCCGEPPAAALRLPAMNNINETNNGFNICSSLPLSAELPIFLQKGRWRTTSLVDGHTIQSWMWIESTAKPA